MTPSKPELKARLVSALDVVMIEGRFRVYDEAPGVRPGPPLECYDVLSNVAFNFKLRRYNTVAPSLTVGWCRLTL